MEALYKSRFRKFVKKQSRAFQLAIEDVVEEVMHNPSIGEAKKGELSQFHVHKFKFQGRQYLIAYKRESKAIVFYMIESHENFYRDLKQYLREVD